jgi:hypothetical protein
MMLVVADRSGLQRRGNRERQAARGAQRTVISRSPVLTSEAGPVEQRPETSREARRPTLASRPSGVSAWAPGYWRARAAENRKPGSKRHALNRRSFAGRQPRAASVFGVFGIGFAGIEDFLGDEAGILADRLLDSVGDLRIVAQENLGVLAPLTEPLAVV